MSRLSCGAVELGQTAVPSVGHRQQAGEVGQVIGQQLAAAADDVRLSGWASR
jgi:hypothetical protein